MPRRTYLSMLLLKIPPPTSSRPIPIKPMEFNTIATLEEPEAKTIINRDIQANNMPIAIPTIITVFEKIISNKLLIPAPVEP